MTNQNSTTTHTYKRVSSALEGIKAFRRHNPSATWADFKAAQALAKAQHKPSVVAINRNLGLNHDYIVGGAA